MEAAISPGIHLHSHMEWDSMKLLSLSRAHDAYRSAHSSQELPSGLSPFRVLLVLQGEAVPELPPSVLLGLYHFHRHSYLLISIAVCGDI